MPGCQPGAVAFTATTEALPRHDVTLSSATSLPGCVHDQFGEPVADATHDKGDGGIGHRSTVPVTDGSTQARRGRGRQGEYAEVTGEGVEIGTRGQDRVGTVLGHWFDVGMVGGRLVVQAALERAVGQFAQATYCWPRTRAFAASALSSAWRAA